MNHNTSSRAINDRKIRPAEAKAMATWIESVLSPDDAPLGYVESLLVGAWRRLSDRPRVIASSLWDTCVILRDQKVRVTAAEANEGVRWLDLRDPMPIFWDLTATRVGIATNTDGMESEEREEVLAVLDGLIGAVSAGRSSVTRELATFLIGLGLGRHLRTKPWRRGDVSPDIAKTSKAR